MDRASQAENRTNDSISKISLYSVIGLFHNEADTPQSEQ